MIPYSVVLSGKPPGPATAGQTPPESDGGRGCGPATGPGDFTQAQSPPTHRVTVTAHESETVALSQ